MGVRLDPSRTMPELVGPIVDTLVIFSGWEKNNLFSFATQLPHVRDTGISAVDLWLDAEASSPAGAPLMATGIYGILGSNPSDICPIGDDLSLTPLAASTMQMAWNYIDVHFDPRGKLIIYGNSAGGDCTLNLCRAISRCKPWFHFQDQFTRWFSSTPDSVVLGETCVDLLITADAAAGPLSDFLPRDVARCVRRNENYYQRTAKWEQQMSRGAPGIAVDPSVTTINNEDWSTQADHFAMGWMTRDKAMAAIAACRSNS